MTYGIDAGCIDVRDRMCIDVCPVDCIYEGDRKLYIHPDECIDCGACAVTCPQNAAIRLDDLEPGRAPIAFGDRSFFEITLASRDQPLGSPNGARSVGVIGADTDLVSRHSS